MTNKLRYFIANWKMFGDLNSVNSLNKVINFKKKNKKAKNLDAKTFTTATSAFTIRIRNRKFALKFTFFPI